MARRPHTTFDPVTIHTAKCDICNLNNKATLYRCKLCGFQICTPCKDSDASDGVHMMNAGERGRPRKWNGDSSPTSAAPEPVSPSSRKDVETERRAQPIRVQSLPSSTKRRKRQIIEESDDEDDLYVTQNVRIEHRGQKGNKDEKLNKRMRSAEDVKPARVTRAAAKASSDIRETADFLLALGSSSPHSTTLLIGEDNRDELGLMLLAEAAALTESPHLDTIQGQDAQVHSPLFFEEEVDLVTLRGSEVATERETSVDDTNTPRAISRNLGRKPQISSGERLQVPNVRVVPTVLTYSLPLELIEVTYASISQGNTGGSGSQRLTDLYQSSLVVKGQSGRMRPLRRHERDRQ
ncbi:hypothetical protein MMC18_000400 [Xylographa bjoerkii]|nr:hypothetical protein [Xylographa bjoerkii]